MPHGHCFLWNPGLVWLHVASDGLIALAYMVIPFGLLRISRQRKDLPFNWMLFCFCAFIIACGATHLMEIWTLWTPSYWLAGALKALTAGISIATAVLLHRLVPAAIAVPSANALTAAHAELRRAHEVLETRVRERTAELEAQVHARERTQAALRTSESRFRRLAQSGILGIFIADMEGNIVEANDTFLHMLGYAQEDVAAGKIRWTELTPAEYAEADARAIRRLQSTGSVPAWEKEYIHRSGERVPVLLGAATLEGDGNAAQCVCFTLDLSERKRAESTLDDMRAQHAVDVRYRALLDTAPDAMIVTGEDGRIDFVNVQAEKLFGYAREELTGQALELLIPERFRRGHVGHLRRFFENPAARPMGSGVELFGLRKDGTELPIEVSLSPLQTREGMTVSASVRDISERKRLEAATKLFADRLHSAVDSIQDAFALFDDRDRLVLCNGAYRALLGDALSGPLTGRPYRELLDAWLSGIAFASDAERAEFYQARLGQRMRATTAFDLRLRDGRSLRVVDRPTSEGGIVKIVWDRTEDERLAEELRNARIAAEAASNAKTEFLSSMSHELRTPLNAILGFAQLLQRDKREPLSERHRERVGRILKGGEHLLHLIDDILDLSRIEAGRVALSIEPLNVVDVLQQVKTTLEPLAALGEIQLVVAPLPAALPLIAGDSTRFTQVLMNFGSNAIKYNRPAGSVTFAVAAPSPGRLRVLVRDTGLGIPADKQDKLFQAFQRAGQETGPVEGTGIGLFITKRIAELMHGDVGFRSVPGEGSEFWVEMPTHDEPESARGAPSLRAARFEPGMSGDHPRSLLYIEDNPASVELMRDLIDGLEQVRLIIAPTAELGLELARAHRPDIIVMDINLPGMSGLDALRELKKSPEQRAVPVIALSAAASERDRQRGVEAGFHAYLTKPLNIESLIALIQRLLRSNTAGPNT